MYKRRDNNIDLVKFIASLFIIGIHTNLFIEVSDFLNFAVVHVIFRLAVPFFAVCSGYYLSKSEGDDLGASMRKMKRQEVKLIKLYLIWSALYLVYSIPTWIKTGWFSLGAFKDYGFALITSGSYYHLWYLASLIYALPLFFLCVKHINNRKVLLVITIVLYLVKAISYGYYEWLPNVVKSILALCYKFSALFDAAFLILPLLLLGYFIRHNSIKFIWFSLLGFVLSFGFLFAEAFTLKSFGGEKVSFILMTFPTAYFFFLSVSHIQIKRCGRIISMLGWASLMIYCFHPMALELFDDFVTNSVFLYFCTATVSMTFAIIIYSIPQIYHKSIHGERR